LRGRKSRRAITALSVVVTLAASYAVTANRTDVVQAQSPVREMTVIYEGDVHRIHSAEATVGATLRNAGIEIGPADLVYPKPNVTVHNGMTIRIVRVVDKVVTVDEPIGFQTQRKPTSKLRAGMTQVISEGKNGTKRLSYQVRTVDGVEKQRKLVNVDVVAKPEPRVMAFGEYGVHEIASRGFVSFKVLDMHASAYDPGPRSCGRYATGRTCTGMRAGYGVVAVDPRVIRLGTRLYVEGYGFAIAGDRGRAIKGHRIDLGFNTYYAARRYGRKHVRVHVLH
jgi:3D (Asp-Asp-Asp) domain-containing protein